MSRYFHISTMGCQMNEYDSDHLAQTLVSSNYLPTDNPKQADIILINTCTVRGKAAQKAYSLLGRMIPLQCPLRSAKRIPAIAEVFSSRPPNAAAGSQPFGFGVS